MRHDIIGCYLFLGENMIEFKKVSMKYPNGFQALTEIDLNIAQGEFVAIIGHSGAGKSTLIRCINKMLDISSGELYVDGIDINSLKNRKLREFRRSIGMLFQSFNLVTKTGAIANVLSANIPDIPFWRVLMGVYTAEEKIRALEMLDKVGILDKAYMRCDTLSGGEQQRVALARTLNQNPKIILADEPVASLDPNIAQKVMEDFKRISSELGITIVVNIHNIDLALKYADRIVGIKRGKIVCDADAALVDRSILNMIYTREEGEQDEEFDDR